MTGNSGTKRAEKNYFLSVARRPEDFRRSPCRLCEPLLLSFSPWRVLTPVTEPLPALLVYVGIFVSFPVIGSTKGVILGGTCSILLPHGSPFLRSFPLLLSFGRTGLLAGKIILSKE